MISGNRSMIISYDQRPAAELVQNRGYARNPFHIEIRRHFTDLDIAGYEEALGVQDASMAWNVETDDLMHRCERRKGI